MSENTSSESLESVCSPKRNFDVAGLSYNRRMPSARDTSNAQTLGVFFLGSGSSGNSTAVSDGTTTVLIDCGFSAREIARRLRVHGLEASSVSGILVTHEHGDHVRGIEVFARKYGCSVWATRGTCEAGHLNWIAEDFQILSPGSSTKIGSLEVLPFRSSHDAKEPVGFVVSDRNGNRFGLATDMGSFTQEAAEALAGCDLIGLECNHDLKMLETGPYPWFLKQRIASARGHLSNADAARALESVATDRLREVHALHLSRTNNTRELACQAVQQQLALMGLAVSVRSVSQDCVPSAHTGEATDAAGTVHDGEDADQLSFAPSTP